MSESSGASTAGKLRDLQLEVHRHEAAAILDGRMLVVHVDPHDPDALARAAALICRTFGIPGRHRRDVEHRLRLAVVWGSL